MRGKKRYEALVGQGERGDRRDERADRTGEPITATKAGETCLRVTFSHCATCPGVPPLALPDVPIVADGEADVVAPSPTITMAEPSTLPSPPDVPVSVAEDVVGPSAAIVMAEPSTPPSLPDVQVSVAEDVVAPSHPSPAIVNAEPSPPALPPTSSGSAATIATTVVTLPPYEQIAKKDMDTLARYGQALLICAG